jgi:ABC-type multidrug transport system fused ATPase/permease subunit
MKQRRPSVSISQCSVDGHAKFSPLDYKTDAVIQSSLRRELGSDVTLLTVAHRLQTIMDADKIVSLIIRSFLAPSSALTTVVYQMVLDAGQIVEFDSPKELLKIPNGRLRSLVDESADKDILYSMAEGK